MCIVVERKKLEYFGLVVWLKVKRGNDAHTYTSEPGKILADDR